MTLLVEAARTLTRSAPLHRSLGKAQLRQKKFAEATVSLERALTLDRGIDGVHGLLREANVNTGRSEAAIGAAPGVAGPGGRFEPPGPSPDDRTLSVTLKFPAAA